MGSLLEGFDRAFILSNCWLIRNLQPCPRLECTGIISVIRMIKAKTNIPSFPTVNVKLSSGFVILKGVFGEDIPVQGLAGLQVRRGGSSSIGERRSRIVAFSLYDSSGGKNI